MDVITELPWPEVSLTELPEPGETVTNPTYAEYLRTLEVPDRIRSEDALCVDYRDHEVCGSSSPDTGMMVVGEALGILDEIGADEMGSDPSHVVTEAQRLALANGNTWMQDPKVDPALAAAYVDTLVTDPEHLKRHADRIDSEDSIDDIEPDPVNGEEGVYRDHDEEGTTQITVRDSDGSFVSMTPTISQHFGSGKVEDGYFINNSMRSFTVSNDEMNQRAPGIRPKTSMSPVIVFEDGTPMLGLGTAGGSHIPSFVIKTIVGIIDKGQDVREAVRAKNYGAIGRDDTYREGNGGEGSASSLSVIHVDDGTVYGESDARAYGSARSTSVDGESDDTQYGGGLSSSDISGS